VPDCGNNGLGDVMRKFFYGQNPAAPYFEGWYFKLQRDAGQTIALIPAIHIEKNGEKSASIQVISETDAWWVEYPAHQFSACEDRFFVQIGENVFSQDGIRIAIQKDNLSLQGKVSFGPILPLSTDIMGPFRWLPKMECAHSVISMRHTLDGFLVLNGEKLDYNQGLGYIESDRGRSFPQNYLWTQCCWGESSIFLSIATIPVSKIRFTGCICAILHKGKEYRIATYKGARVEKWSADGAVIRQGKYRLEVKLLEQTAQRLRAPANGKMCRTVQESLCAKVHYRLWEGDKLIMDKTSHKAGYEYA